MSKIDKASWSLKRRIGVALVGTVGILLVALVLGGGSYLALDQVGWVGEKAMKRKVAQTLMDDPKVLAAVAERSQVRQCINKTKRLAYEYWPPLEVPVQNGGNACMQLVLTLNNGEESRVALTKHHLAKESIIPVVLDGLEVVQTESEAIRGYAVTVVDGLRNGNRSTTYLISVRPDVTWEITIHPSSETVLYQLEPTLTTLTLE